MGDTGITTATVTITVAPANDPPDAVNDAASTSLGTAVDIAVLANDSDPDGDALSIQSFTQGANGAVAQVGAQLRYTPAPYWSGTDSFTYTISDGHGGSDTATVTVQVAFAAFDIIVDNAAATLTNKWKTLLGGGCWGPDSVYSDSSKATARFSPSLPVTGWYDVYIWYVASPKNSTKVPVNVYQTSVPKTWTFTLNQRVNGSQWIHLGRFPFLAGTGAFVEVTGKKGRASADAVKFTCAGPL